MKAARPRRVRSSRPQPGFLAHREGSSQSAPGRRACDVFASAACVKSGGQRNEAMGLVHLATAGIAALPTSSRANSRMG
jgi:hypothetical protein